MAGGRNARGDEIDKLCTAVDAVHRVDEIDAGQGLADHRTLGVHRFLFDANMDYRVPHVQRIVDQV